LKKCGKIAFKYAKKQGYDLVCLFEFDFFKHGELAFIADYYNQNRNSILNFDYGPEMLEALEKF